MIYFIIGCQGVGHHLFTYACPLKEEYKLNSDLDYAYKTLKNFKVKKIRNKDTIYLASFPYNNPMDAVNRPDLNIFKNMEKQTDIKMIYIYRDPWEATISCHKRWVNADNNIFKHANIVLDNLIYLSSFIREFDSKAQVFDYRDICNFPDKFTEITGLKLNKENIKEAKPYDLKYPNALDLIKFFKERKPMYKEIINNVVDLYG
jgi:hypothetical protein